MQRTRPRPVNAVFQEDWWLDAVAPGRWGYVEVRDGGGLKAWMPYVFREAPLGLLRCDQPPLTQTLGPWLAPPQTPKYWKALGQQQALLTALIEQLPAADLFRQNLHYSVPTALPFHQHGFALRTAYTYVIEGLNAEGPGGADAAWAGLSDERRRVVRRAREQLEVVETDDLDTFWQLNALTYQRQGAAPPYSRDYLARLDHAAAAHDARRIFLARDEKGRPHAATYVAFNEHATYYLAGGADPELAKAGGTSLALWAAIEFASQHSASFDFEGSMMPGIEHFFRSFGGQQKAYVGITKRSPKMRVAETGRELLTALRARLG